MGDTNLSSFNRLFFLIFSLKAFELSEPDQVHSSQWAYPLECDQNPWNKGTFGKRSPKGTFGKRSPKGIFGKRFAERQISSSSLFSMPRYLQVIIMMVLIGTRCLMVPSLFFRLFSTVLVNLPRDTFLDYKSRLEQGGSKSILRWLLAAWFGMVKTLMQTKMLLQSLLSFSSESCMLFMIDD